MPIIGFNVIEQIAMTPQITPALKVVSVTCLLTLNSRMLRVSYFGSWVKIKRFATKKNRLGVKKRTGRG